MAYWIVDFMDRAGRLYHITIEGAEGNTDIPLIPSDNPVTIEEEGDDNLFVPIKTQSGSIEIVTDDYTIARDIIPNTGGTRHVVIYYKDSTTEQSWKVFWYGYVQPKMLTYTLWKGKQKLKIPIECILSGLKYHEYTGYNVYADNQTMLFDVLYSVLYDDIYSILPQMRLLMQMDKTLCGGTEEESHWNDRKKNWLWHWVYNSIFTSEKSTKYDVLEALCTFFGFTARQSMSESVSEEGRTITLFFNRNVDAAYPIQLVQWDVNSNHTTLFQRSVSPIVEWTSLKTTLTEGMLRDNKTKIKFSEGIKKATAECELVTFEDNYDAKLQNLITPIEGGYLHVLRSYQKTERDFTIIWGNLCEGVYRIHEEWTPISSFTYGDFIINSYNTEFVIEKNDSEDVADWQAVIKLHYSTQYLWNVIGEANIETHEFYEPYGKDVKYVEECYKGYATIKRQEAMTFPKNGVISINVNGSSTNNTPICFNMYLGTKVWTGSGWETGGTPALLYADRGNPINLPVTTNENCNDYTLDFVIDPAYATTGYSANWATQTYSITGFSIEYNVEQGEYNSSIDAEYSSENGAGFAKTVDFSSLLTVKEPRMQLSKSFLYDDETPQQPITGLIYSTNFPNPFNPLQQLCNEATAEMSKVGQMIEITIDHYIKPSRLVYIQAFDAYFFIVGGTYDLRNREYRVKLLRRDWKPIE